MDKCKVHAWSTNECATMVDWEVKQNCSVSLSCELQGSLHILLACVLFPALRATLIVAILQAADGKDSG